MSDCGDCHKVCPRCGAGFACLVNDPGGCWCAERPHVMPLVEGAGCLCPQCLDALIAERMRTPAEGTSARADASSGTSSAD